MMMYADPQRHSLHTPVSVPPSARAPDPAARRIEMARLERRDVRLSSRALNWELGSRNPSGSTPITRYDAAPRPHVRLSRSPTPPKRFRQVS